MSLIGATSAITSLIGAALYPVLLPETTTYPALTFQVTSASSDFTLDRAAVQTKRIQFDSWGSTYSDCKTLSAAVGNLLDGFSGALPDGTRVLICESSIEIDWYETNSRVYRTTNEYIFKFV